MRRLFLCLCAVLFGAISVACGETTTTTDNATISEPTFLLFYTDGWPPWQEFALIVNGLETQYDSQMTFTRLNVDEPENEKIQQQYRLRGHPSVAIVNVNGETVQTFVGVQQADTLIPIIEQAINP